MNWAHYGLFIWAARIQHPINQQQATISRFLQDPLRRFFRCKMAVLFSPSSVSSVSSTAGGGRRWLCSGIGDAFSGRTAYEVLGVPETSSFSEIKASFRKLAKETHPDVSPTSEPSVASHRFLQILAAYEVGSGMIGATLDCPLHCIQLSESVVNLFCGCLETVRFVSEIACGDGWELRKCGCLFFYSSFRN